MCVDELRKYKKLAVVEVLNMAINRTLTRTVLTSVTTLLALFSLFIFGGEVIRGFSMGLDLGRGDRNLLLDRAGSADPVVHEHPRRHER